MFLPQMPEQDEYDTNGQQKDDINSVIEYFAVTLGFDHTPDDEDDDNGQNFHIIKFDEYSFNQFQVKVEPLTETDKGKKIFPQVKQTMFIEPVFEVPIPPPEV
jgi:hypothetical protein